jgi:signal transduction histidine kinase
MPPTGTSGFELRFDLAGRAAVRVSGGPVAPRHVEPVPPQAPWVAEARCGEAAGWLLANVAPEDPEAARASLARTVEREAALRAQALRAELARLTADLLERLTHRLRTDVTTLQAVAEGALAGLFEPEDLEQLPGELQRTGRGALERLTAAREVMRALAPEARREPEPIAATLRAELEAAGREATVREPSGEQPRTLVPGPGWAACARALAADPRLELFDVGPDRAGWSVVAGAAGEPVEWTERTVGTLVNVGHLLAVAGGSASVMHPFGVKLVLPAAPPSG